jgi:hypothetical protein
MLSLIRKLFNKPQAPTREFHQIAHLDKLSVSEFRVFPQSGEDDNKDIHCI